MKVKIIKVKYDNLWYKDYIGEIYEVVDDREFKDKIWNIVNSRSIPFYSIYKEDCDEVTMESVLTKAEALKLCIDGQGIVNENCGVHSYIKFNGEHFVFNNGHYANLNGTQWKLWEPPKPKFSKGQFVVDGDGFYAIIRSMEYKDNQWSYVTSATVNGSGEEYIESELTEVSNGPTK